MKKTSLLAVCLVVAYIIVFVSAGAQAKAAEAPMPVETEISNPGILPTNPFYFIKEWSRGIRKAFTTNQASKAALELKFADEKIAEAKKVQEINPNKTDNIVDAIKNYKDEQGKASERIKNLEIAPDNQEAKEVISQLISKTLRQERILDDMAEIAANKTEVRAAIDDTKKIIDDSVLMVSLKDASDNFSEKLEEAFDESASEELGHLKSVEVIDRVLEKAPESARPALEKVREKLSQKLRINVRNIYEKSGTNFLKQAIKKLPSVNPERKSMILEKIRSSLSKEIGEVFDDAREEELDDLKEIEMETEIEIKKELENPEQPVVKIKRQTYPRTTEQKQVSQTPYAIKIIEPNGEEEFKIGDTIKVGWKTSDVPAAGTKWRVSLTQEILCFRAPCVDKETLLTISSVLNTSSDNEFEWVWKIGSDMTAGKYKMKVELISAEIPMSEKPIVEDISDEFFRISE